jgi:flagellar hook-associated protein 3 FlgL
MRIATTQYQDTMNSALQNAGARLQGVMKQMATGQRILVPSDDPITSVRISRITREEAALTQYRDNISALSTHLQHSETALDGMVQNMLQVRDLLVWASDGSNTSADVNAMASSLIALRDSLFYSGNNKDQEGRYLFSGTLSNTPTVTYTAANPVGSRYSFTGNTVTQLVVVGAGITQPSNTTLEEMPALLNLLDTAIQAMQAPGVSVNNPVTHTLVSQALDGVDITLGSISSKIAGLGGAQNILSALDSNHSNVSLSNKQAIITLVQLDYSEAATRLSAYNASLQATQKAYSKVSTLSLFDVI